MKYILIILTLIVGTLYAADTRVTELDLLDEAPVATDQVLLHDTSASYDKRTTCTHLATYMATENADATQTLTNKSIDADDNTITDINNDDIKAAAAIAVNKLAALTTGRVVVTDGSGFVSASDVLSTELVPLDATNNEHIADGGAFLQFSAVGADQVKITDGTIEPNNTNEIDLGTTNKKFQDAYLVGNLYSTGADIDGAVTVDVGNLTFNDASGSYDARMETNNRAYAFELDGSADMLNVGCAFGFNKATSYTFDNVDATPSVIGSTLWHSGGAAEEITDFDDGQPGQLLMIISEHDITFDSTAGNLYPYQEDDLVTAAKDVTVWVYVSPVWYLVSFSDNSR